MSILTSNSDVKHTEDVTKVKEPEDDKNIKTIVEYEKLLTTLSRLKEEVNKSFDNTIAQVRKSVDTIPRPYNVYTIEDTKGNVFVELCISKDFYVIRNREHYNMINDALNYGPYYDGSSIFYRLKKVLAAIIPGFDVGIEMKVISEKNTEEDIEDSNVSYSYTDTQVIDSEIKYELLEGNKEAPEVVEENGFVFKPSIGINKRYGKHLGFLTIKEKIQISKPVKGWVF